MLRTSLPPIVPAPTPAPAPAPALTAGLGRRLALCLSLATLFYLRQVSFWAVPKNRYYVHWQRSDALMLVVGVAVCAALLFAVAELVRRVWPDRGRVALRWLTVLFVADVVVGYAAAGSRHDAVPSSWAALAWVVAAGVGLYVSGRAPRVTAAGARVLGALAWLAPISLVQMLSWKAWDVRPTVADTARRAAPHAAPHAGGSAGASTVGPVFIFVFDEWSYQRSYAGGQLLPLFEHVRRFAGRALEFTDAHSPAGGTTISLPRLLFQRPGELRVGNGAAEWVEGDSAVPSTRLPSLFAEAAARGYVTSIDGFYLPYRAILGDQVDTVRSEPHIPKGQTASGRVWVGLVRNLGYLADPLSQQVWARWYARAYSDNWARMNQEMRGRVKRMIRESRANTFALLHWPLPHAPFVFNADGSYRGPFQTGRMEGTPEDYRRHLRVLDATFGELVAEMEAAGVLDSALIVVTSDHSWKAEPEARFTARADAATWVPLFVKLPGQVVGERAGAPFCLGQLASLLARVADGTPVDARGLSEVGGARGRRSCAADSAAITTGLGTAAAGAERRVQAGGGHIDPSDPRVADVFDTLRHAGLTAALVVLEHAAARDSAVLRDAHQLAHALGREAVSTSGDVSVLRTCRPAFASGCYHGVVEGVLRTGSRIDMSELERVCADAGGPDQPGAEYECIHGLGHGVFGALGMDLRATLRTCDELSTSSVSSWCHAGAFMEAINGALAGSGASATHAHAGGHDRIHDGGMPASSDAARIVLDSANPYSPCDRFDEPYASSCWLFQPFVILRWRHFDVAAAFRACDAAPNGHTGSCYEGMGLQLTGLFQRDNAWIVGECARGQAVYASRCASGAVRALGAMDWSGKRGVALCAGAPTAWKGACYRSAFAALSVFATAAQRAVVCSRVEPAYVSSCRTQIPRTARGS